MKNFTLVSAVVALMNSTSCASKASSLDEPLLARPLIVGASVSGDTGTLSPGKRLSQKYSRNSNVKVVAKGGSPGREVIQSVSEASLSDRTVIIGLDFLFWDSSLGGSPAPSIAALESLIKKASDKKIPLVIGDVPELLPGSQPARVALNKAIYDLCKPSANCVVVALDDLHKQVKRDGYLLIKNKKFGLRDIVPDGLHLSAGASEEIAERIYHSIKESLPRS